MKAVIFDMYETLVTHFDCPLYFGKQMAQDAGIAEEKFLPPWRETEHDRTVGIMTTQEGIAYALKANGRYSQELCDRLYERRVQTKRECFSHLNEEILPLLSELRSRQIKIGLISNCFSEEAEVIRGSVLFPFFDAVLLSCEQGIKKPDEEIYRRACESLNVKPIDCLYVGDGGGCELDTAMFLGMRVAQATWYLKEGAAQPVGRLENFRGIEHPKDILCML